MCSSLKIIIEHSFTISVFWLLLFSFSFLSLRNYYMFSYFLLFYFTRTMKIITGRRRLVLTVESPTTMGDNNKLAVFAGYYTRCIFPLSVFLNGVAGIHPSLISLNEIKTRVFEFFLACLECDSLLYNILFSSQELSCRHKPFSNSKLTDPSASSGTPHSREMTDPQPGLNSEYLESETVFLQSVELFVLCRIAALSKDSTHLYGSLFASVGDENLPLSDFLRWIRAAVILIIPVASAVLSNIGVRKVLF